MPDDLGQIAQDADHEDRWGMAPTGNDLQKIAARGLPPPQPTPYGVARAQERQQRWGLPGPGGQLVDLAKRAGQGFVNQIDAFGNRVNTALYDEDPYTRAYAGAGLGYDVVTGGMGAAPRGALGMAGGMIKDIRESGLTIPDRGLSTFHGSPENFERFDYNKVGTGAGTAYGHGIYLAENPEIAGQYTTPSGYMYETGLRSDPAHFIDLNRPYHYQSQYIKSVMDQLGWGSMPGQMNVLVALRQAMGNDKVISDALLNHGGIKGFKYLDQFSRYKGHGTRNYVVLNDKTIDIWKKYGVRGIMAMAGLGAYHFQRNENEQ